MYVSIVHRVLITVRKTPEKPNKEKSEYKTKNRENKRIKE